MTGEFQAARAELTVATEAIQRVPGYENFFRAPASDQIQRMLGAVNGAGVYIVVTSVGGLALIVRQDGIHATWLELTEVEVNAWLAERNGEQSAGGYLAAQMGRAPLEPQLNDVMPLLGERVMRPVAEALKSLGVLDVTLIPCGRLALFPLHAAEYQVNGQMRRFMDEFTVTYTPSARALGSCRDTLSAIPAQSRTLCGVGNPLPLPARCQPTGLCAARSGRDRAIV